jgi:glycosyltransferase involved in cell wall biosynthesis
MAEALAMGKPVVAKAFGGALDVVRDGVDGVLVRDGDFAGAIEKVSRMSFGDLRAQALERFSFEKMIESSLAVYRELAQGEKS